MDNIFREESVDLCWGAKVAGRLGIASLVICAVAGMALTRKPVYGLFLVPGLVGGATLGYALRRATMGNRDCLLGRATNKMGIHTVWPALIITGLTVAGMFYFPELTVYTWLGVGGFVIGEMVMHIVGKLAKPCAEEVKEIALGVGIFGYAAYTKYPSETKMILAGLAGLAALAAMSYLPTWTSYSQYLTLAGGGVVGLGGIYMVRRKGTEKVIPKMVWPILAGATALGLLFATTPTLYALPGLAGLGAGGLLADHFPEQIDSASETAKEVVTSLFSSPKSDQGLDESSRPQTAPESQPLDTTGTA